MNRLWLTPLIALLMPRRWFLITVVALIALIASEARSARAERVLKLLLSRQSADSLTDKIEHRREESR